MHPWERVWVDYYEELGISPSASPRVIGAAWRAMAKDYHPDAGGTEEHMKRINIAYRVLSDPNLRQQYDRDYKAKNANDRSTWNEPPRQPPASYPPSSDSVDNEPNKTSGNSKWKAIAVIAIVLPAIFLFGVILDDSEPDCDINPRLCEETDKKFPVYNFPTSTNDYLREYKRESQKDLLDYYDSMIP